MAARARNLSFTVTPVASDLEVDADRSLLAGAVMNLLTNAFKFTAPRSHVWLRTSATSDRVILDVEDQCGGLSEPDPETLFAPWSQQSSDKHGLGLGLPLVRRSIQALDGEVDVTNLPGEGCVFSIQLLRPAPLPQASTA